MFRPNPGERLFAAKARRVAPLLILLALGAGLGSAEQASVLLRMPGLQDRPLAPSSLLGHDRRDVRVEDRDGGVLVYHGLSLLEVLEKNGLALRTMAEERKAAPAVVVVTARDGYTVVFSVGELAMHRSEPRVYLVAETSFGLLAENEAPMRLIVLGDRARSAYGLARIELKYLAQNSSGRIPAAPPP